MKILIVPPVSGQMQKVISLMKKKLEGDAYDQQAISSGTAYSITQNVTIEIWNSTKLPVTCAEIKKLETNLFINFDLAGFGQSTLTDGIAYNLLDCKQIHILLKDRLPEERHLAKQLSISMFFYCVDARYCRYLQEKYPDIPYLRAIEGWKRDAEEGSAENHAEVLQSIVREVMQLCRMLPQTI